MAVRKLPPIPKLSQISAFLSLMNTAANLNWKPYKMILDRIKSALPDYWGRALLAAFAAVIVLFVAYDWRRAHVAAGVAQAQVIALAAERDGLLRAAALDAAARAKRAEDQIALDKEKIETLKDVQAILAANDEWASQRLPDELRRRLDQ